jgi:hypothetical protein
MIELQTHSGFYRCEAYGFAEWLAEVQGLIQKGYEFDFESNSNYPMQIGHIYTAILKPKQVSEQELKIYPGGSPDTPAPLVIASWAGSESVPSDLRATLEETTSEPVFSPPTEFVTELQPVVSEQKVSAEVQQPAKRGPKPKQ